jgi:hypothetical protein
MMSTLLLDGLGAQSIATISRTVTGLVGIFVAALAYRGYRRNDAPEMRSLAVGIALLTAGTFLTATLADQFGAGDGVVLLARGVVTVAGLCAVLYALVYE